MTLLAVYTTVARREQADAICAALVERRLVACAQIDAVDSVYVWQGALQREPEFRLLLKTTAARYDALAAALRELHPYALPAIYALPVVQADAAYAAWVEQGASGGV